ncbi:MAG: RraA family protein, partial [Terriglobia bacterium]
MTDELLARCAAVATSTWSDALDRFAMPGAITGLALRSGAGRVCGIAVTVKEHVGELGDCEADAFAVGRFLDAISAGSILVVAMGGAAVSTFGGLAARAAVLAGLSGAVIDGGCRDIAEVRASGLWLSSRHVTPVSGRGRVKVEGINVPVSACGVSVIPGDTIIGDETGIVCIGAGRLPDVLAVAEELTAQD